MEVVVWTELLGRLMVRKKRATGQEERQLADEASRATKEVHTDCAKVEKAATPPQQ